MKKSLILISLLCVLFVSGCGNNKKAYETKLEQYGKDYFEKYVVVQGLDEVVISIADLKNANEKAGTNYDLKKLSKCSDDTKVKFTIEKNTKEIKETNFELNCK